MYYVLVSRNGRVRSHNKLRVNKQPRLFNLAFLTVINVDWGVLGGRGVSWRCIHVQYIRKWCGRGPEGGWTKDGRAPWEVLYNVHYLHDRPTRHPYVREEREGG